MSSPTAVPSGYTLRAELGHGRLGRVLLCRDDGSGRDVVVRVLDPEAAGGRHRAALESELAAAAAASRHPCAVPVEAVWYDPAAGMCLRQKHFPGGSAQALVGAEAPWEDVVVLGVRAVAALTHAHRHGVLHLDVRPQNFLADAEGNWALADGGLARAVTGSTLAADPRHAPRELLGWEEPGTPADVYGLGSTLGALLAAPRQPAASGLGPTELRPGLPPALVALLNRMTAPDPAARPPLPEVDRVLRAQLSRAASDRVPAADPVPVPGVVPLPVRHLGAVAPPIGDSGLRDRRRRVVAIAAGIALLFVALAGGTVASLDEDKAEQVAESATPGGEPAEPAGLLEGPAPADEATAAATSEVVVETPAATVLEPAPAEPDAVPAAELGPAPVTRNVAGHLVGDVEVRIRPAGYMISWEEPAIYKDVVGYLVVLTTPKNDVIARQFAGPGQTLAVFTSPPLAKNSCLRISTLVDAGEEVRIARQPARDCRTIGRAFDGRRP